jgi:hypothetical protein
MSQCDNALAISLSGIIDVFLLGWPISHGQKISKFTPHHEERVNNMHSLSVWNRKMQSSLTFT